MNKFSNFKNTFLILLSLLILLTSCRKEIDLHPGHCHDVRTFLRSKNANISCGVPAQFEGNRICLQGMIHLERDFLSGELTQVVLVSSDHGLFQIPILFDDSIKEALDTFLHAHRGVTTRVNGKITGFDRPENFKCTRGFEMRIEQLSDFDF